jgi:hypothetical protein
MESATPARDTAWAMSEENIGLFLRFNDAFNRGDLEGAIALVDPPPEFDHVSLGRLAECAAGVARSASNLGKST